MIYQEECQIRKALASGATAERVDTDHPVAREWVTHETRRQFLRRGANALGMAALAALGGDAFAAPAMRKNGRGLPNLPNFPPKAKRVIYLHMVGGPPQMDMY